MAGISHVGHASQADDAHLETMDAGESPAEDGGSEEQKDRVKDDAGPDDGAFLTS